MLGIVFMLALNQGIAPAQAGRSEPGRHPPRAQRRRRRPPGHGGEVLQACRPPLCQRDGCGDAQWPAVRKSLDNLGPYDAPLDLAPPAGGLILKVYARGLIRDPAGRLQIYRTDVARSREAGRDHLWLTEAEWQSLLPTPVRTGEKTDVPGPIVERICRRSLIDLVRVGGNGGPRRSEEVLSRH